jgi:hypothetical protein
MDICNKYLEEILEDLCSSKNKGSRNVSNEISMIILDYKENIKVDIIYTNKKKWLTYDDFHSKITIGFFKDKLKETLLNSFPRKNYINKITQKEFAEEFIARKKQCLFLSHAEDDELNVKFIKDKIKHGSLIIINQTTIFDPKKGNRLIFDIPKDMNSIEFSHLLGSYLLGV